MSDGHLQEYLTELCVAGQQCLSHVLLQTTRAVGSHTQGDALRVRWGDE